MPWKMMRRTAWLITLGLLSVGQVAAAVKIELIDEAMAESTAEAPESGNGAAEPAPPSAEAEEEPAPDAPVEETPTAPADSTP